jgi:hypothetical protein
MNAREYQRVTIPPLPKADETNSRTVIRMYNEALLKLIKIDEDKEKRIRQLEEEVKRNKQGRNPVKYFGERWRIIISDDGLQMNAQRSNNNFQTIDVNVNLA